MKIGCSEVPKPTYPSLLWLAEWKAPAPLTQFGNISEDFEIIWTHQYNLKPSDWKVSDHMEISGQFWNHSESFEIIWQYFDSPKTVKKVLKLSGNVQTVFKPAQKFEVILKQFWNRLKNLKSSGNVYTVLLHILFGFDVEDVEVVK